MSGHDEVMQLRGDRKKNHDAQLIRASVSIADYRRKKVLPFSYLAACIRLRLYG